jgi:hypothetical protein
MAIPNKLRGSGRVWVRVFASFVGLVGIVWGFHLLPMFWNEELPARVASKLLQGQPFKAPILEEQVSALEAKEPSFCSPTRLRILLVLQLKLLSTTNSSSDEGGAAATEEELYDTARAALRCTPADSISWLVLFWLDVKAHGLQPKDVNYLRMSYAFGPHEGWIALWRNSMSILVLPRLPDDLKNEVLDEFAKLVDTGQLYQQTVAIFVSAPPAVRARIVEKLRVANSIPRQFFAKDLYDRGIDVDLPGVGKPTRPWQ